MNVTSAELGGALQSLLVCQEILPGSAASYQVCKAIYAYHPLGRKMVDSPIVMAQSQAREIAVADSPEDRVREAFLAEWTATNANEYISQTATVARIYGVASIIVGAKGLDPASELPLDKLWGMELFFNVLDPLNTAGSLVLGQDPNAPDFLKYTGIAVQGIAYHRSRSVVVMNERPIYIEYTSSAFGYVGRSVYQRALYPLKSFVSTMVADDMVARKVGLLIAKLKPVASAVNAAIQRLAGVKRQLLQEAETNNVLSITTEETVESLNLQNIDGAGAFARGNILKNIATAADMPAKLLDNETMVEGFGEGTEDARNIARYVDGVREWMGPLYAFFDDIVMRRAWNPEFFEALKSEFPETYGKVSYTEAFYEWKNSFRAKWPSLLKDPETDQKNEETRQKAVTDLLGVLLPTLDPVNTATTIQWAVETVASNTILFPKPLVLDYEALAQHVQEQAARAQALEDAADDESTDDDPPPGEK